MDDRLESLIFLPPETGLQWRGHSLALSSPLFYSNPPWHQLIPPAADALAKAIADAGVTVAALLKDLSSRECLSSFHQETRSRMVPYRPERYGLLPDDFDESEIVDLRLTVPRNDDGRFAYAPDQIARWENSPAEKPLAGGSWVPAASFPPDVPSLDQLSIKIGQLRVLAPSAVILVSLFPHRLDSELPKVLSQKPDGVLLRCVDPGLPPLSIAKFTQKARQLLGDPSIPLWIDAVGMTPTDCAKLTHLGATAVSIDAWCVELFQYVSETMELGAHLPSKSSQMQSVALSRIASVVDYMLVPYLDEYRGYCESMAGLPSDARIAATDPTWADALGLALL
jgi:hypothetical protein